MSRCLINIHGLLVASALCWPSLSYAQADIAKQAIIVSSFDLGADPASRDLRDDALAVSEGLLGLGYNVRRFENPKAEVLQAAVRAADGDDLVVYYAGAALPPALSNTLARTGFAATAVFLDVCRTDVALGESAWTLPEELAENTFVAAAVPPGTSCGAPVGSVAAQLLDGLSVPGLSLDLAFEAEDDTATPVWTTSTMSAPPVLRPPASDMRLTADDYALLDSLPDDAQAQMMALWAQAGIVVDRSAHDLDMLSFAPVQRVVEDTIVLSAPVRPVRSNGASVQPRGVIAPVDDGISVIAATAAQSNANRAVPGVGGLPSPSIIVGLIAQDASFETAPEDGGTLTGAEFDYSNLEARRAMRNEDPALFSQLIEAGAFDPAPATLAFAIQSELTRMNCYTLGIDGRWGGGSEAALRRYYAEIGETPENLAPTLASFHKMLLRDDVTCPPVVVAAAPRPATTAAPAPRRQQAAAPAAPRRQAAPAAPAAPASRTFNSNSGVTGVFR